MKRIVIRPGHSRKGTFRLSRIWRILSIQPGVHRRRDVWFVDIYWARLAVMALTLMVLGYFSGTFALYLFWDRRPHNQITYLDVLIPTRWSEIRPKQGKMLIAQANEMLAEKKIREAFHLLRAGLRLYPQDEEARIHLASIMIGGRMNNQASRLLVDGLAYGYPQDPRYLEMLLFVIKYQEDVATLTEVFPILLKFPEIDQDKERKYTIIRKLMMAQLAQGKYLELLALAERINADEDAPYKAYDMIIMAHYGMGNYDEAYAYLNALDLPYRNQPVSLALEAGLRRELGDRSDMLKTVSKVYHMGNKAKLQQAQVLSLLAMENEERWLDIYLDEYVNTYKNDGQAIDILGAILADLPSSDLLKKVKDKLSSIHPHMRRRPEFFLVQALTAEGRFAEARELYDQWRAGIPDDTEGLADAEIFDTILTAALRRGQDTQAALIQVLRERKYPAEAYWWAALAMYQSQQPEAARTIINYGVSLYPSLPALQDLRRQILDNNIANKRRMSYPQYPSGIGQVSE